MKLKAIIVDDEIEVAKALQLLLKKTCEEVEVIATCHTLMDALKVCRKKLHDIVFLDIEMPGGTGFDLIEVCGGDNEYIIFTTAHSQYAIRAIKAGAKDYLLKPVNPDELVESVQKAKNYLENHKNNGSSKKGTTISVVIPSGIKILDKDAILYIKADGRYSELHCTDHTKYLVCRNIGEYENELGGDYFFRVHKSFLINCKHVNSVKSVDGGFVELSDKTQIEISKRKKKEFLNFLK